MTEYKGLFLTESELYTLSKCMEIAAISLKYYDGGNREEISTDIHSLAATISKQLDEPFSDN